MENKPTYNISTFMNEEILEIVSAGVVTYDCVEIFTQKIQNIVKSRNATKLLSDVSALKMPRVCSEAYSRIRKYPPFFRIKTAIVDHPENEDFQMFQEAAAAIAGIEMKYFTDADTARAWLRSE